MEIILANLLYNFFVNYLREIVRYLLRVID